VHPVADVVPRRQQDQRRQEGGQHDQDQADPVDREREVRADGRDPGEGLDQLQVRVGDVELPDQRERRDEGATEDARATTLTLRRSSPMKPMASAPSSGKAIVSVIQFIGYLTWTRTTATIATAPARNAAT
jgi:hypothetical protein